MHKLAAYEEIEVTLVKEGKATRFEDKVAVEYPVTVFLNDREIITLLCTPEKMDFLALGFLYSEGFLEGKKDWKGTRVDEENGVVYVDTDKEPFLSEELYGKRTLTTGCGKGTVFYSAWDSFKSRTVESDIRVSPSSLHRYMRLLQENSGLYGETGGVHSAALCSGEEVVFFCEDVGRHNALDKIVGECLEKEISLSDKVLACSGRMSSEMLLKAAKLQIPVLVSRAAPTSLSIEIARSMGVTMVGFARGGRRMTVYAGEERVLVDER